MREEKEEAEGLPPADVAEALATPQLQGGQEEMEKEQEEEPPAR